MAVHDWFLVVQAVGLAGLVMATAVRAYISWLSGRNKLLYLPLSAAYAVACTGFVFTGIAYGTGSDSVPTLLIGSLAILATVLAITAGLGEVREALPKQRLNVNAVQGNWRSPEMADAGMSYIEFSNSDDAPVINAYRLNVALIDAKTHEAVAAPPRANRFVSVGMSQPIWIQDRRDSLHLYSWTREEESRWFPGTRLGGPSAPQTVDGHSELLWRVRWATDRSGPVEVYLAVPDSDA